MCVSGDVHVKSSFYNQNAEKTAYSYFRFEVGGDLVEIDQPREPPILSDSVLRAMLDQGLITQEEHQRATGVGLVARYHILRFPQFRKQVYPLGPTPGTMDITPDSNPTPQFRAFLKEIHERRNDRSNLELVLKKSSDSAFGRSLTVM